MITFRVLPGRYAKFLAAVAGQALVWAQATYGSGNRWVQIATGVAAALAVLGIPNTPKPVPPLMLPPLMLPPLMLPPLPVPPPGGAIQGEPGS